VLSVNTLEKFAFRANGRATEDEIRVAATVVNLLVHGHDVDVLEANVDSQTGRTVPEEVGLLFRVGDVEGRLQRTRC